jgi:hypothetical protein
MDYSQMMRMGAGAVGGFGQSMMDRDFGRRYDAGRAGGFSDLMQNQKIGDFVRTGGRGKSGEIFGGGRKTRELGEAMFGDTTF